MDKLLQSLLREWDYLLQLQDETLKALPEYPLVYSEYTRLADELEQHLPASMKQMLAKKHARLYIIDAIDLAAGNKALYRRYEGAHSAYLALCERASLLCGAHTALRLLLTLL